jgi:predicted dehydrogenase
VEWPLANGQADIEERVQAAKEGGGRTVMGLQARCSPVIQKVYYIGAAFVHHSQVTYFPG